MQLHEVSKCSFYTIKLSLANYALPACHLALGKLFLVSSIKVTGFAYSDWGCPDFGFLHLIFEVLNLSRSDKAVKSSTTELTSLMLLETENVAESQLPSLDREYADISSNFQVACAGWDNHSMLSVLWQEPLVINQTSNKTHSKLAKNN